MSGTLYIVATPIGNLEDITLRALRVLREVAVIAAEDTRRTAKLLNHYNISTCAVSFHEHNAIRRMPQLLRRLEEGASVAVVSDAGTPLLSDPGLELVRGAIAAGIPVDPVPGASASLAAFVASGFTAEPLTILGFAPNKANARMAWVRRLLEHTGTTVFFEAPHRIEGSIRAIATEEPQRMLTIARELTKLHQEILRGTAAELVEHLTEPRGEFTVVVGPPHKPADSAADNVGDDQLASEFRQLTNDGGLTRRAAINELSRRYRRPSRDVYASLERAKPRPT